MQQPTSASTNEIIEAVLRADELGDGSRDLRLKYRQHHHAEEKEAVEIREKAIAAAKRRAEEEDEAARKRAEETAAYLERTLRAGQDSGRVDAEVAALRKVSTHGDCKSFIADTIHMNISRENKWKDLKLRLLFPQGFPAEPLVADLESKLLHPDLVDKLQAGAERKAAELAKNEPGAFQAPTVYQMITNFLDNSRLVTAYEDMIKVRELCGSTDCKLGAVKEKTGSVLLDLIEEKYHMSLRLTISSAYPAEAAHLEVLSHNLPLELEALYKAQAENRASHLAEPPRVVGVNLGAAARAGAGAGAGSKNSRKANAKQTFDSAKTAAALVNHAVETQQEAKERQRKVLESFEPQRSLWPMVSFLYSDCLLPLVRDRCSVCEKHLVPSDPAKMQKVPKHMLPERLYCGHVYHHRCLETYINEPPFTKGCKVCGKELSHHRFCTDPKILESRWSFKNARQREIDEVAELML